MLDTGILTIYKKIATKSTTGKPVEVLELYTQNWYGEMSFGVAEYYAAKQAQAKVEKRIRIHQDTTLCNRFIIEIGVTQYEVGRIYNGVDKGILITDITLERVTQKYDIS